LEEEFRRKKKSEEKENTHMRVSTEFQINPFTND